MVCMFCTGVKWRLTNFQETFEPFYVYTFLSSYATTEGFVHVNIKW